MSPYAYPESKKMDAVQPAREAISDFVNWLSEQKGITLAYWNDEFYTQPTLQPQITPVDELIAEHLGYDLKVVEQERRAMLEKQREMNERIMLREGRT